jgi:hypothetical protein
MCSGFIALVSCHWIVHWIHVLLNFLLCVLSLMLLSYCIPPTCYGSGTNGSIFSALPWPWFDRRSFSISYDTHALCRVFGMSMPFVCRMFKEITFAMNKCNGTVIPLPGPLIHCHHKECWVRECHPVCKLSYFVLPCASRAIYFLFCTIQLCSQDTAWWFL